MPRPGFRRLGFGDRPFALSEESKRFRSKNRRFTKLGFRRFSQKALGEHKANMLWFRYGRGTEARSADRRVDLSRAPVSRLEWRASVTEICRRDFGFDKHRGTNSASHR